MNVRRRGRRAIFLELPNFGYGPASALLTLLRELPDEYEWHVVTTGAALDFVRAQLNAAAYHDLDTFDADTWPALLDLVPSDALLISCTNPHLAGWALDHGMQVGVIDTLDWMWASLPESALSAAQFHIVQTYFGAAIGPARGRRVIVRPIVDTSLWSAAPLTAVREGTALIAFGGMHVPGGHSAVSAYVRWFLGSALPALFKQPLDTVTIVGGRSDLHDLVPPAWRGHPALRIRTGLSRAAYARAVRSAEHLILTPGLASIYECALAHLTPLLQPGFNVSMVLQHQQIVSSGYPHLATWPWLTEAEQMLGQVPELEGVRRVAAYAAQTIEQTDTEGMLVAEAIGRYAERDGKGLPLHLALDWTLPDGADILAKHLQE